MAEIVKLVVFVPETHADQVRHTIGEAGAGVLGKYRHCSFSTKGIGRFRPEEGTNPAIGEVGKLEEVAEERIEVMCTKEKLSEVITAIKNMHPYEEIPIDVYPLAGY